MNSEGLSREDRYAIAFRLRAAYLERRRAGTAESVAAFLAAHTEVRDLLEAMVTEPGGDAAAGTGEAVGDAFAGVGAGEWIGPYRLVARLGHGGMGTVYLAERPDRGQRVAIKVMHHVLASPESAARFDAECRTLARMNHDSIARCFDSGATPRGEPYLVMELVDGGKPLSEWCDERALGLRERIALFLSVCDGVQHAHIKGIVHRDLKPQNVLVAEQDGRAVVKIIDFGIAAAIAAETDDGRERPAGERPVGTWEYMSPEQACGAAGDVDLRTDVYSLGVMLYQLLSGVLPFSSGSLRTLQTQAVQDLLRDVTPPTPSTRALTEPGAANASRVRGTTPPRLSRRLRGDLDWIVGKAMAKSPEQRYASPRELAEDLQRYLDGHPVAAAAGVAGPGYRVGKALVRHRSGFASALAVVATAVAAFVLVLRYADEAEVRAAEATQRADDNQRLTAENAANAGFAALQGGRWQDALDKFELARRRGYTDVIALQLGCYDALEALGLYEDADELLQELAVAGREGPHAARIELLVGADCKGDDVAAAGRSVRHAFELDRTGVAHLTPADREYAGALLATDLPAVEAHLRAALGHESRHLRSLNLLAPILMFRGEASAMLTLADSYEQLYPAAPQPRWLRVVAFSILGRFDRARGVVEEIRHGPVGEAADLLGVLVDGMEMLQAKLSDRTRATVAQLMAGVPAARRRFGPPPVDIEGDANGEPDILVTMKKLYPLVLKIVAAIKKIQVVMDDGGMHLRLHPWVLEHYSVERLLVSGRNVLSGVGLRPGEGIPEAHLVVASGFKTGIDVEPADLVGITAGMEMVSRTHAQLSLTLLLPRVGATDPEPGVEAAILRALPLQLSQEELLTYAYIASSTVVADPKLVDRVLLRWSDLHGRTEWWRLFDAEVLLMRGDRAGAAAEVAAAHSSSPWAEDLQRRLRP